VELFLVDALMAGLWTAERDYYCKRPILCLSSKILTPHPPLRPASVSSPPGGEGDGGSIFWKTRDIGLASYSNILSTMDRLGCGAGVGGGRGRGQERGGQVQDPPQPGRRSQLLQH
jgi:hypothetical protein